MPPRSRNQTEHPKLFSAFLIREFKKTRSKIDEKEFSPRVKACPHSNHWARPTLGLRQSVRHRGKGADPRIGAGLPRQGAADAKVNDESANSDLLSRMAIA